MLLLQEIQMRNITILRLKIQHVDRIAGLHAEVSEPMCRRKKLVESFQFYYIQEMHQEMLLTFTLNSY